MVTMGRLTSPLLSKESRMTPSPCQVSLWPKAIPSEPGAAVNHIACVYIGGRRERVCVCVCVCEERVGQATLTIPSAPVLSLPVTRRLMSTIQCLAEKLPFVQIHPRLLLMEGHTLTWSSLGIQPAAREGVRKMRESGSAHFLRGSRTGRLPWSW